MTSRLILGDCLEIMPTLPQVDAIITDLPYGTTACAWDEIIPFVPMWEQVKCILKPRGVFVTTASQPFTSKLVMSNLEWFKYEWIWEKSHATGFLDAKEKPMRQHENIEVFYEAQPTFNPQLYKKHKTQIRNGKAKRANTAAYGGFKIDTPRSIPDNIGYPLTIQYFPCPYKGGEGGLHPTQKPIALLEYLILTYTNPGDTVLDICAGSGTTGVAAHKTGRNSILIEKDAGYFEIMQKRIHDAEQQPLLFEGNV